MSVIITFVAAVFAFGIMIVFHEFGHFICAKLSGIQVNEFSIGMGPAIVKKVYKGTQYSLRLLPIGGYVAMEGEDSAEADGPARAAAARRAEEEASRNGNGTPGEGRDGQEEAAGGGQDREEGGPGPDFSPIPFAQRTGRPFNEVSVPRRFITVAAGAMMNFVLAFLVILVLVCGQDVLTSKTIYSIEEGALCGQTGLQAGDEIVAVNGRTCYVADDIIYELTRTENYAADFTVRRGGGTVELENVQFDTWQDENGDTHMSLNFIVYGLKKTPLRVLTEALNYERYYGRIVFSSLADLARGRGSVNDLSGPVGIVSAIGEAASYGLENFLTLLALLSVNLGIMNLLPLPALDGGKLVFLIWEGITKKPVSSRVQEITSIIGFALLFGLLLFATYNDIARLITGQL